MDIHQDEVLMLEMITKKKYSPHTSQKCAVDELPCVIRYYVPTSEKEPLTDEQLKSLQDEIAVLKRLQYVHLQPIMGMTKNPNYGYISPYNNFGNLRDRLGRAKDDPIPLKQKLHMAASIIKALLYLEEKGLHHLSLKSAHVLVFDDLSIKLIDYGFENSVMRENIPPTYRIMDPAWVAPELMYSEEVGSLTAVDIYAFGMVAFNLFAEVLPFPESIGSMALGIKVWRRLHPSPASIPHHLCR